MNKTEIKQQYRRIRELRKDWIMRPLPRTFKQLILCLLDHVNSETLVCWPAQPRLATQVGVSIRSIQRNLRAVEKLGLFTITSLGTGATSTHYRLNFNSQAWQNRNTEAVAKVVSLFTNKGKGVTRASSLKMAAESNRGDARVRIGDDAGVRSRDDAVPTRASSELPQGSVAVAAKHAPPPPSTSELSIINSAGCAGLAASPLAGRPPAAESLGDFHSDSQGDGQQLRQEEFEAVWADLLLLAEID